MRNTERELIIENALREYNDAKRAGDGEKIARAVNNMENVFCCVCLHRVRGTEALRQAIIKEKYN